MLMKVHVAFMVDAGSVTGYVASRLASYCPAHSFTYYADHPDPKASPFIALLKQYMERVGGMSERPAFSTEDCCELEQESTTACTEIAQAVSQKQASASSRQRSSLQDDLSSSIATAVQVGGMGTAQIAVFLALSLHQCHVL